MRSLLAIILTISGINAVPGYACDDGVGNSHGLKLEYLRAFTVMNNLGLTDLEVEDLVSYGPNASHFLEVKGHHEFPVRCQIQTVGLDLPSDILAAVTGVVQGTIFFNFDQLRCGGMGSASYLRIGREGIDIARFEFSQLVGSPRKLKLDIGIDDGHSYKVRPGIANCEF